MPSGKAYGYLCIGFAMALVSPVRANTFYVAPAGSNGNTGSIGSPWGTLEYAIDQLSPGDTLLMRGESYREHFVFRKITVVPGTNGVEADPELLNDFRPGPDSPANSGGIDLSSRSWPDTTTETHRGTTNFSTASLDLGPRPEDTDGDSLPDLWELSHAVDLLTLSSNSDADGDGTTDYSESAGGTYPMIGSSILQLTGISSGPGGATLNWEDAGLHYLVLASFDLSNWNPVHLSDPVLSAGSATITNAALESLPSFTPGTAFFRIQPVAATSSAYWPSR